MHAVISKRTRHKCNIYYHTNEVATLRIQESCKLLLTNLPECMTSLSDLQIDGYEGH